MVTTRHRALATTVGTLVAAGAVIAVLHGRHTDADARAALRYSSAVEMAQRVGCTATLKALTPIGPARDAGDCTTSDGVRVQFRIFDNADQATGWGSAMSETDRGPVDVAEYGENWVARVVDGRRDQANTAFSRLG